MSHFFILFIIDRFELSSHYIRYWKLFWQSKVVFKYSNFGVKFFSVVKLVVVLVVKLQLNTIDNRTAGLGRTWRLVRRGIRNCININILNNIETYIIKNDPFSTRSNLKGGGGIRSHYCRKKLHTMNLKLQVYSEIKKCFMAKSTSWWQYKFEH